MSGEQARVLGLSAESLLRCCRFWRHGEQARQLRRAVRARVLAQMPSTSSWPPGSADAAAALPCGPSAQQRFVRGQYLSPLRSSPVLVLCTDLLPGSAPMHKCSLYLLMVPAGLPAACAITGCVSLSLHHTSAWGRTAHGMPAEVCICWQRLRSSRSLHARLHKRSRPAHPHPRIYAP